jgi:hypothetical protein
MLGSLLCFLFILEISSLFHLPPCKKYMDTYGSWLNITTTNKDSVMVHSHFYHGGAGEALNFSAVWLPNDCSYHRFTNETIFSAVEYYLTHTNATENKIRIQFLGDSTTRGLYCSICRILAGSEVRGPIDNSVCGGPSFGLHVDGVVGYRYFHEFFFDGKLQLSFVFVTSYLSDHDHIEWKTENAVMNEKLFAVVVNTGAWDFHDAWSHELKTPGVETCVTDTEKYVGPRRAAEEVRLRISDVVWYAKEYHVKLIYRNNYYNARFGTICADSDVEKMFNGTGYWEIFDSTRISKDVWESQEPDGLHVERRDIWTIAQHEEIRVAAELAGKPYPGMLEMQLTQSFLNNLFHEFLVHRQSHFSRESEIGKQRRYR